MVEQIGQQKLQQLPQNPQHSPHYQGPGQGFSSTTDRGAPRGKRKQRTRRAKAPQAPPQTKEDPRIVLGFPPNQALTQDQIKKRRRELARILHSDQGGNDESMKRLNSAADALLSQL
jgi:hypothetical protein